jgi:carbon storage regulator CsrA
MSFLVVTREVGDEIHVNGPSTIRVVRIDCNKVRIGIEADPGVNIRRGELADDGRCSRPATYRTEKD